MYKELLERIKELSAIDQSYELEIAERLLDAHLRLYPRDTDTWLRLFMIISSDYLLDKEKAIACCKKIFTYDPYNTYALLALFYIYYYQGYQGSSYEDEIVEKLLLFQTDNYEHMSLIELARAWYYEDKKNTALKEKALLKSIVYCDYFVCNYEMLGYLYVMQNKLKEAQECLQKGLSNIQKVIDITDNEMIDKSNIECLFDEFFRGTSTTDSRRDRMQSVLDSCNEMLGHSLKGRL